MTLNDIPIPTHAAQLPSYRPLVLLIEEDIRQQIILQDQLKNFQCEVHLSDGYKGALLLTKKHQYDLIFIGVDEVLGNIGLDALTDAIRQGSLNQQTPVAIIGFDKMYKATSYGKGVDAVSVKPFTHAKRLEFLMRSIPDYRAKKRE